MNEEQKKIMLEVRIELGNIAKILTSLFEKLNEAENVERSTVA